MHVHFVGTGSILSDRHSASALIDGKLLIDAPNGSMKTMRRSGLDPKKVDICLITHFHADHFADIIFLFLEQGIGRTRDSDLILVGPTGFADHVEQLFELSYPGSWASTRPHVRPRFVELDAAQGGQWSGGGYQVRAYPMRHAVPTLGYAITDESGARLGYTGDTSTCPSVDTLAAECPVLVCDTTFPEQGRIGHMGLAEIEALAERWPGKHFLTTHLSDDVPASSRPNVIRPADGQGFDLDAGGLVLPAEQAGKSKKRGDKPVLGIL
ncbi:MBL fold metallo-hydrolase [Nonomuraea sp. NPDC050790]|uniref:MBL fold metallo-hydrolase n=1 Tax=Nonomuraea sp. NPDC050790 TaxID=3364371 RepID=UPI00378B966F